MTLCTFHLNNIYVTTLETFSNSRPGSKGFWN